MACSKGGAYEVAEALLAHGASMELARTDGTTALMLACQDGHEALITKAVKSVRKKDIVNSIDHV